MWDLWWTKWHWDQFFSESFGFPPVNIIPLLLHIHSYVMWGMDKGSVRAAVLNLFSAATHMMNDVHMRDTLPWAYPDFDKTQKKFAGK
jgi:hypothetical protein